MLFPPGSLERKLHRVILVHQRTARTLFNWPNQTTFVVEKRNPVRHGVPRGPANVSHPTPHVMGAECGHTLFKRQARRVHMPSTPGPPCSTEGVSGQTVSFDSICHPQPPIE